jgi:sulfatase modifying factor 1
MKRHREWTLRAVLVPAVVVAGLVLAPEPGLADASTATAGNPAPGSTFRDCADGCPEMVVVGAGRLETGPAPGEEEREGSGYVRQIEHTWQHLVTIRHKFALGKYDVTRGEFSAFVRDTGYQPAERKCRGYAAAVGLYVTWQAPGYPQTDRDPVVCVTWKDVNAYLTWLSRKAHQRYRLPSEAEWEYAARAGTSTARFWGDVKGDACRYANVADLSYTRAKQLKPDTHDFDCDDGYVYTSPVGSFRPNQFGLYDMIGNVYQLAGDCFDFNAHGEFTPADGSAWLDKDCMVHVARGSTFGDGPSRARAAFRFSLPDMLGGDDSGFRVARDL